MVCPMCRTSNADARVAFTRLVCAGHNPLVPLVNWVSSPSQFAKFCVQLCSIALQGPSSTCYGKRACACYVIRSWVAQSHFQAACCADYFASTTCQWLTAAAFTVQVAIFDEVLPNERVLKVPFGMFARQSWGDVRMDHPGVTPEHFTFFHFFSCRAVLCPRVMPLQGCKNLVPATRVVHLRWTSGHC